MADIKEREYYVVFILVLVYLTLSLQVLCGGSSLGKFWGSCGCSILRFLLGLFCVEVYNEFLHHYSYYCRGFKFILGGALSSLIFSPSYLIIFLYL
jgi:hypothetical protein